MRGLRFRWERRLGTSRALEVGVPVASILLALFLGGILIAAVGADPLETYGAMWSGSIGSFSDWFAGDFYNTSETIVKAIPLILTGLAVAVAFKMKFWNIGAEGQLVMGGVAASGVALFLPAAMPGLPQSKWLYVPLLVIAGFIGGALWALIAGALKAYLDVNEIIVTLMLNYVAILWYQQLYNTSWKDPDGFGFPGSADFETFTWFPRFFGTRVHFGLILGLILAVGVWLLFDHTKRGYEIRMIGDNPDAARFAGMSTKFNVMMVMLISGGIAGLAGAAEVGGISHKLAQGLDVGNGFTAIIVAWIARLKPWAVVLVAILLAAVDVGGDQLQISFGLPSSLSGVLEGLLLFSVLGGGIFSRYKLTVRRLEPKAA